MNKANPKVSIVLPTYNGSKYIRQSIDSCLNQTYQNIELITVDDCSADNTPDIINSYKDERIKYIRHQKNMGLPGALNTGFANSTGEYLSWTSDDNFYAPEAIEKMLEVLRSKNGDFVYSDYYEFIDENKEDLKLVNLPDKPSLEKDNFIRACFLYRRRVFEAVGNFDTDGMLIEDYDYWIRISKRFSMMHLDKPLYFYRIHKASLYVSKSFEVKILRELVRLKYNFANISEASESIQKLLLSKVRKFYKINNFIIKHLLSRKIHSALRDFKCGNISFIKSKIKLASLINSKLLITHEDKI